MWKRYGEEFNWGADKYLWEAIINYMNDEIREDLHMEIAPCTNRYFVESYIEKDPEFEQLLAEEFGIEWF